MGATVPESICARGLGSRLTGRLGLWRSLNPFWGPYASHPPRRNLQVIIARGSGEAFGAAVCGAPMAIARGHRGAAPGSMRWSPSQNRIQCRHGLDRGAEARS